MICLLDASAPVATSSGAPDHCMRAGQPNWGSLAERCKHARLDNGVP